MMEKAVITALIGTFASVGYVEVADQAEDILAEANVVAAAHQERELMTALELYRLDNPTYPQVSDEAVVDVLFDAGLLKKDEVPFEIEYDDTKNGKDYILEVS